MNIPEITTEPNRDRDCQVTLQLEDGAEFTWTILRDRDMRWQGHAAMTAPVVAFEVEWFDNPPGGFSNGR